MAGRPRRSLVAEFLGAPAAGAPLQSLDALEALGASPAVRTSVAFTVVLVLGGVLVWRYDSFLDRATLATLERPLAALGYGVAAHVVIVLVGVYLATRLSTVVVSGGRASGVGLLVGAALLVSAAAVGFTVAGVALVDILWGRNHWSGLAVGAILAGIAAVVAPTYGAVAWVVVASIGIGGLVRRWVHASVGGGR